MGHIKEPAGVDFIINSRPLTKEEEITISKFITSCKTKQAHQQVKSKKKTKASFRKKLDS